jgi:regulator of sirC expression with transglutaminase-like and TPR domain
MDALKEFDKCLEMNPNFPDALYNRGVVRLQLKQRKSACEDLNKAAELGYQRAYSMLDAYCK